MPKRSRLSKKMPFTHDRRLQTVSLGDYFSQGEAYEDIMKSAGVKDSDTDVEVKKKLTGYLKSAGAINA